MVLRTEPPVYVTDKVKPSAQPVHVLIIEGRFYEKISDELVGGAITALQAAGASFERIAVAGALEIPQALAQVAAAGRIPRSAPHAQWDGAVALGCVIRGQTAHYDIVCNNANHWLMDVAIRKGVPVGNGILTVETETQALERARGGVKGKGGAAARACLGLIELARAIKGQRA